jgi:Mu-like prophage major head subunit gpT
MTTVSRRDTLKMVAGAMGVAAVIPAELLPGKAVAAPTSIVPSADLITLRDKVQAMVDAFDPSPVFEFTQYKKLFKYHRAFDPNCRNCDSRLDREIRLVTSVARSSPAGAPPKTWEVVDESQRFTWILPHDTVELGYAIHPDTPSNEWLPTLISLARSFKEFREMDAAKVFDTAMVYNPDWCGDGVSICSENHPHDTGVWSNRIRADRLDTKSIKRAVAHLDEFRDDGGLLIRVKPRLLVVPIAQIPAAERLKAAQMMRTPGSANDARAHEILASIRIIPGTSKDYFAYDYLENNNRWFLLTDVEGLVWSERRPFSVRVEIDAENNQVLVIGSERRGFGCMDPRALVGAFPASVRDLRPAA